MKRRKTKIKNIQPVQSEEFEEDIDDSEEFILTTTVSPETKDFLEKYDYIISDGRLSVSAVGLMVRILTIPRNEVFTIEFLQKIAHENENELINELEELVNVGYIKSVISSTNQPAYVCNVD